ncbi:hypothetical protein [Paraurantiacibacter namhicola]|uniref:Uncharacterized protein n=1 Tax=Paraurantiacibacter namhicola TaxID=645517 RepID=A0A1C7D896_9SPHN|nr:hypothetical protein [Paraurantiacibacter namhicola]ANU07665.1 hypothetical protein A6F65_01359 [Paraurantiacibacter namhicola]
MNSALKSIALPKQALAFLALLLAPVLAGCGAFVDSGDDTPAPQETAATKGGKSDPLTRAVEAKGGEDCLLLVWEKQDTRDEDFDRAHDMATGGAISCATNTSASRFDRVLKRLRDAATRRDKAALLSEVGIPLLYIDENGNQRLLEGEALDAAFDEAFTPEMLDTLAGLDLRELSVVPGEGGFFRLGALWLVVDEPGGDPKLVSVNAQALGEAAEAARDKSETAQGVAVGTGG